MMTKVVHPQDIYALVVGIECYADPTKLGNLPGCANDAIRFARWLYEQRVPPKNISLCLSSLDAEHDLELPPGVSRRLATHQTVFEIFTELTSTQGEMFVLFWAGHGVIKSNTRRLFFADATWRNLVNMNLDAELGALETDAYISFPQQFCFVDACATLIEAINLESEIPDNILIPKNFQYKEKREQYIAFAAKEGENAYRDRFQEKTSLFVRELMEELAVRTLPLDLEALSIALMARFERLNKAGALAQTPNYYWGKGKGWNKLTSNALGNATRQKKPVPFMVEDLPLDFVPRLPELEELIEELLDDKCEESVAITAALQGAGGYGKTTMAQAVCHDPRVRKAFDGGILWVTLGVHPHNIVEKIEDLILSLSGERPNFADIEPAAAYFKMLLAEHKILLVIDDVWNPAHLKPFLQGGKHCRRLITTRDDSVLPRQTHRVQIDAMRSKEALRLLSSGLQDHASPSLKDIQDLRTLVKKLGEWPLILTLVNGVLRERVDRYYQSLSDAIIYVNRALEKFGLTVFDHKDAQKRDQAVKATLQVSFELLSADEYTRYKELAIFPEDIYIPLETLQRLWSVTSKTDFDDINVEILCESLRRLSLLLDFDPVKRVIRLHDVVRTYLQREVDRDEFAALHRQLLDSYAIRRWADLPQKEPYLWDHLASHLVSAGSLMELIVTVQDLYYLAKKTVVRNAYATQIDLLTAVTAEAEFPEIVALQLLQRNFTNMSHLLIKCQTLDEVAVTLHSRLIHLDKLSGHCRALEQALTHPFLSPWHMLPSLPHPALMRTLRGHTKSVRGCTVSWDEGRIVSASDDCTLKVWDAQTGAELLTLKGHTSQVFGCAISRQGDYIVSASLDSTLKIWDAQTGTELLTLKGHTDQVHACAISPDGRSVVSASQDHTLKVWDAQKGTELLTLQGHTGTVSGCAFSPNGKLIVSASNDKTLKVWDIRAGEALLTLQGHTGSVEACAFSPDGEWIVSASADRTLKLWDARTGATLQTLQGHKELVYDCAVSPDGTSIASASRDATLKIWDAHSGKERFPLFGHSTQVYGCAMSSKGNYLVSASGDDTLKIWNVRIEVTQQVRPAYEYSVNACAISHTGNWVVAALDEENLKIWDVQTGTEVLRLEGHADIVRTCAVSPKDDWIVSGADDDLLLLWERATGKELAVLEGHTQRVCACAVDPEGHWIVSASDDCTLKVWDVQTGREIWTLQGHNACVNGCAVSPDGKYIVSASADGTLKIWNARTGREQQTLRGHTSWVNDCAVSPRGDYLVSASNDYTLKVWNIQSWTERLTFQGHTGPVSACAVSPEGDLIASVAQNGTIKVWNAYQGQCLTTLSVEGKLRTCAFYPDSSHLVVGGYNGLCFLRLVS